MLGRLCKVYVSANIFNEDMKYLRFFMTYFTLENFACWICDFGILSLRNLTKMRKNIKFYVLKTKKNFLCKFLHAIFSKKTKKNYLQKFDTWKFPETLMYSYSKSPLSKRSIWLWKSFFLISSCSYTLCTVVFLSYCTIHTYFTVVLLSYIYCATSYYYAELSCPFV